MADVKIENILFRFGARCLARHGVVAVAGSRRGLVEVPLNFARADASPCAFYWDRDGLLRVAAANVLRADDWGPFYEQGLTDPVDGSPVHGPRIEQSRTNVVLWNRDLTNAAWVKTGGGGVSAAKDQTGVDGVASSASRITATGANGTCLQAITLGSSARAQSVFVKRLVGAGNIDMTMDNGSTWTTLTGLSTTAWTRVIIPTQTLANPTVGFRIVTNADSVAIDFVQNENGVYRTNPIPTTTGAVTRQADALLPLVNFGPVDYTSVCKIARAVWCDAVGSIVDFPGMYDLGNNIAMDNRLYADNATRTMQADIQTGGTNSFASRSIPAGAVINVVNQNKNLTTGGQVAQDVGAGQSAFGAVATAKPAFGSQTLGIGRVTGGVNYLNGVMLDLVFQRGVFTFAEAIAAP